MRRPVTPRTTHLLVGVLSVLAICLSLFNLIAARSGIAIQPLLIGTTPATVYRPEHGGLAPTVVIAHGFAGSQQLMQSFAIGLARNGYIAVTFDFAGHGRNPKPLTGSIVDVEGATRTLVDEMTQVADVARGFGDGRVAVLGHSMASDIVVRFAAASPEVAATIAVSMFSPAVTATSPRNLLVIDGDWEGPLKAEALRAVGLAVTKGAVEPGKTYGDVTLGTGRRVSFSPHTEHVSVLFSQHSVAEAVSWLDQVFGTARSQAIVTQTRGPWIVLLVAGAVGLAWPLSRVLPIVARSPRGAGLRWKRLAVPLLVPMIVTPLILRVLPTHFLPILVGDYLAVHFAFYGTLTALCLLWAGRGMRDVVQPTISRSALVGSTGCVLAYGFAGLVWPINTFFTSFVPGPERYGLVLAMLVGTLLYFIADEWTIRGPMPARGAAIVSKLAFLVSLGIAVSLDFERLFFLIIIVPVIIVYFLIHGLFSWWSYRRTGHPLVGAIATAVAFAWAIGVTFPLLAG